MPEITLPISQDAKDTVDFLLLAYTKSAANSTGVDTVYSYKNIKKYLTHVSEFIDERLNPPLGTDLLEKKAEDILE